MKNIPAVFLILFLTLPPFLSAQATFSYSIEKIPFKNPINNFDTTYAWYCHLQLSDTTDVLKIHFKMGTTQHGTQIIDYPFEFDRDAILPVGLSYRREDTSVRLGLGNHLLGDYFIEVRLEDGDNNMSSAVLWQNM